MDLLDLLIAFPERSTQIKVLESAFTSPTSTLPFPLFIYGPQDTGKTSVLQLFHEVYQQAYPGHSAFVSCSSVLPFTLFFRKILQQWVPHHFDWKQRKVDTLLAFVRTIQEVFPEPSKFTRVLILDNAEELLSFPPPFFQALLKLNELTHQPILLVFISSTVWSLFTRLHPSFQIVFPPYSTNELISIYQRWQPTYDPSLVAFLIHALVDTLHMYMPGLIELHALLQRIYPTLSKKIQDGSVTSSPASLFRAIKQDVTQAPRQLYQGHLMSTYTTDLPELQKYILLASYLASHNASKWDTVYFQKFSEKKRSKAWTSSNSGSASYPVGGGSASVQHGAWFPFERMLPILKAITQEQVVVSMDILPMVAQLVALKYLLQYKSSDMLQPLRLKSQISLSFADSLAQSIAFDLRQCLHQPSAF